MPEVSLVAILDADKEGFLRSETSLIQTIGRAARNVRGRVILYADDVTGSMARAIAETQRRRQLQLEYNQKHGITPETVKKAIKEFMPELAREGKEKRAKKLVVKTPAELADLIKELEHEMFAAAKRLEFEKAAQLRDEIRELRRELIGIEG